MRVYQFRHVGTAFYYRSTSPPNSATIAGFAVLRQTNFHSVSADFTRFSSFPAGPFSKRPKV